MTSDLRDHSKPCEHFDAEIEEAIADPDFMGKPQDFFKGHIVLAYQRVEGEVGAPWCPGGAEVTIDYEAAAALFEADLFVSPTVALACARNVIAVALGMGGDDDQ